MVFSENVRCMRRAPARGEVERGGWCRAQDRGRLRRLMVLEGEGVSLNERIEGHTYQNGREEPRREKRGAGRGGGRGGGTCIHVHLPAAAIAPL